MSKKILLITNIAIFYLVAILYSGYGYAGYSNVLGSISIPLTKAASLVSGGTDASFLVIPSVNTGIISGYRINCSSNSTKTTYTTIIWVKSLMKINGVSYAISNISSPSSTVIKEDNMFRITRRGGTITNPDTCNSSGARYDMAAMETPRVVISIDRSLMIPGTNKVEITFAGVFGELRQDFSHPNADSALLLVNDTWKTSQVNFNFTDPGCVSTPINISFDHGSLKNSSVPGNTQTEAININCINNTIVKATLKPVISWANNISGRIDLGGGWYSQLGFVATNIYQNSTEWVSDSRKNQHTVILSSTLGGSGKSGVLNGSALLELQYE
ncbi:hypothetical protein E8Q25_24340 [Salmonella enterica]|nr:hypothetical protein [Salmonella enterica subsp. enterica serovar Bonariensis]EBI1757445.1 hypothetical protein [Salmonella enterica]EBU0529552.1 hypothetical protein [Salmonella enterica]EBU3699925.1 hypothetical protein [Salmonella enterica]ECR9771358.1 hypothetical protein [Salmonella enterica]